MSVDGSPLSALVGTKRTAAFLSSVHPDMYLKRDLASANEANGTTTAVGPTTNDDKVDPVVDSRVPAGDADDKSPCVVVNHSFSRARRSSAPIASQAPLSQVPFVASKRQAAFLLSISTMVGSPTVSAAQSVFPTGENEMETRVSSSPSSSNARTSIHPQPSALLHRIITKQGDKARMKFISPRSEKSWGPIVVTTMLATFFERRASFFVIGEEGEGAVPEGNDKSAQISAVPLGSLLDDGGGSLPANASISDVSHLAATWHDDETKTRFLRATASASLRKKASDGSNAKNSDDEQSSSSMPSRRKFATTYYSRLLTEQCANRLRSSPQFANPFFLDDPDTTGERRRKRLHFRSYLCTVISFADKRYEKKDINQQFFLRHPYLEQRDIKLSHIRSIKTSLLQLCLEESSPLELFTIAYATWYFERLVTNLFVTKQNRKLVVSACVILAIKFWESGNVGKKIVYTMGKLEELFDVDVAPIRDVEFQVFVALDFTLLPPDFEVGRVYAERLLQIMNIRMEEYFSKNFEEQTTIMWSS